MLWNCDTGEDTGESLGQQGDQTSLLKRKSTRIFIGRTDAEVEAPILWPPDASLELVKDWETWHAAVHGVAKSQTRQSD